MRTFSVIIGAFLISAPAQAGAVQTVSARLEGKVTIDAGNVTVDGKKVLWSDVLYLMSDAAARQPMRSERVHLRNGEVWTAELVGMADKTLEVRSDLLGSKKLALSEVAALDFGPRRTRESASMTGTMVRIKGEPVVGTLLSIKGGKVVVDSVVGELDLPRETLASYRFVADGPRKALNEDWVYLADGSILRGQLTPHEQGFQLKHAAGNLTLPAQSVCSVVRHPARLLDLAECIPASFKMSTILGSSSAGADSPRPLDGTEQQSTRFVKGLPFEPKAVVKYKLDGDKGTSGRLRAVLLPTVGAAGDARLTIKVGGKILLERDVTPTSRPETIAIDVKAGDEVELLVDFGARLRFPCDIVLGDPHVVWN